MPLSYAHSQGDGTNRLFDVPCEYLSKSHVTVKVDGVLVPFTWVDTFRLQTTTAPAARSVVEVRRTTPKEERLVTFTDGSTLVQSDLNTSSLQSFFLAQEAFDQGAASMAVTEDGQFSALNRRLANLADPVNAQDAVTKAWALSAANTNLTAAVTAKTAAETARTGAQTARTGAETARTGAETARAGAEAARDAAMGYRDTASAHRLNAQNAQSAAEIARAGAETAKVGLETARDAAAASAAAAKKSAEDAAYFDPSSYYTKVQIDTDFDAINEALGTKANSSSLTSKFDKAGGALTGGISFGAVTVSTPSDTSRHIQLHSSGGGYGISVSSGSQNYMGSNHNWYAAGGSSALMSLSSSGNLSLAGSLGVSSGGTGATTAAAARNNLGLGDLAVLDRNDLVYTGSSASNLTFPIGHVLSAYGGVVNRNAASALYLYSADTVNYSIVANGSALVGTWRSRGGGENGRWMIFQRVA